MKKRSVYIAIGICIIILLAGLLAAAHIYRADHVKESPLPAGEV